MPNEAPRDREEGRNRGPSRYLDHGYRSPSLPRYYVQREIAGERAALIRVIGIWSASLRIAVL